MQLVPNILRKMFSPFEQDEPKVIQSIVAPSNDDHAIEHEVMDTSGLNNIWRGYGMNLEPEYKNLPELIEMYREIASHHEVQSGIADICDQAIVTDEDDLATLNLNKTNFSPAIQTKIADEFETILNLLDFRHRGYDYFRDWYIDGRKVLFKVVDPNQPKKGIQELRVLDPRQVIKIREVQKKIIDGEEIVEGYKDFFVYRPADKKEVFYVGQSLRKDYMLPVDSVVYAHSGLTDCDGKMIISYLHQAIKPANMLKMLEDSALIYMIARAPERRVFYIDTGNLPKIKAEQYIKGIMNGFKNKMTYDAVSGKVKNGYNAQSMMEDFWLPRREGSKGTEIQTLPGGQNMDATDLLNYYKQNLYDALQVPTSRVDSKSMIDFGAGGTEITREELKFDKFITRLQQKFATLMLDPLRTNLILKRIITEEEWEENKNNIIVQYAADSYFAERKAAEMLQLRLSNYTQLEPIIGVHVSYKWAAMEVLKMTEIEIENERKQILEEQDDEIYKLAAQRSAAANGAISDTDPFAPAPFGGGGAVGATAPVDDPQQ